MKNIVNLLSVAMGFVFVFSTLTIAPVYGQSSNKPQELEFLINGIKVLFKHGSESQQFGEFKWKADRENWFKWKGLFGEKMSQDQLADFLDLIASNLRAYSKTNEVRYVKNSHEIQTKFDFTIDQVKAAYYHAAGKWEERHVLKLLEILDSAYAIRLNILSNNNWFPAQAALRIGISSIYIILENITPELFTYKVQRKLNEVAFSGKRAYSFASNYEALKIFVMQANRDPGAISIQAFKHLLNEGGYSRSEKYDHELKKYLTDMQFSHTPVDHRGRITVFKPVADYEHRQKTYFGEQDLLSSVPVLLSKIEKAKDKSGQGGKARSCRTALSKSS